MVLATGETPVDELRKLQETLLPTSQGHALWIKRDDRSAFPLGGNKARKLEFLLGEARKRGVKSIVTSGGYGSNHALATALAGQQEGFQVTLLLGPQPVTPQVKNKLLAMHATGAELHFHSQFFTWGLEILFTEIRSRRQPVYRVAHGGSSFLGILGYVNAFLELRDQFRGREFPRNIFLPVGTSGTAAGLLAGACLSGLLEEVHIYGVPVLEPILIPNVVRKAERLLKELSLSGSSKRCDMRNLNQHFHLLKGFHHPGYGAWTEEVDKIVKLFRDLEGIELDETYSGKAMQGMISTLATGKLQGPSLFWLTYNSFNLDIIIQAYPWKNPNEKWRDLPKAFWSLFRS